MAQGDLHVRTRKDRDGRDEASLEGLPSAAIASAARARQTREPFRFLQTIFSGSILPRASTRVERVGMRSEKEENGGYELATMDREGGGTPVSSERGKDWKCAFTFAQSTQARGVGGRGVQGGAVGRISDTVVRW
jgi:hypothetical protein